MRRTTREVAKFFAGYAFAETIGHWAMAFWAHRLLPLDLGFFTFTSTMNAVAMAIWPIVLIALAYVGWRTEARAIWTHGHLHSGRHATA